MTNNTTPTLTVGTERAGTLNTEWRNSNNNCYNRCSLQVQILLHLTLYLAEYMSNYYSTVTDSYPNVSSQLTIPAFVVDTIPPIISNASNIGLTNDTTPSFSFDSNEAGTIDISSISTNTTTCISGNNTIIINDLSDGIYSGHTLTVTDFAGNISNTLTIPTFTINTDPPTVTSFTISDLSLNIGETANVVLSFSKAVRDFSSNDDIIANNGTLSIMTTTDNITWSGTFTPDSNIEDISNTLILTSTYTDLAGNVGASSTTAMFDIDTINSNVTNVTSSKTDGIYTIGEVILITLEFDDDVIVTGTPRINIENGFSNAFANYVSGSNSRNLIFNYTVASGDRTTRLNYVSRTSLQLNGGTIKDEAGNDSTLTLPHLNSTKSLAGNKAIVIDTISPIITSVNTSKSNGRYTVGEVISINVNFNEQVTVSGIPRLLLETGPNDANIDYISGNNSNTLTFNYTVRSGDTTNNLNYNNINSLTGTITDSVGNNANLTLPTLSSTNSLGGNSNIIIDTTSPTILNVTSTKPNGNYKAGEIINISINFNENVNVCR